MFRIGFIPDILKPKLSIFNNNNIKIKNNEWSKIYFTPYKLIQDKHANLYEKIKKNAIIEPNKNISFQKFLSNYEKGEDIPNNDDPFIKTIIVCGFFSTIFTIWFYAYKK